MEELKTANAGKFDFDVWYAEAWSRKQGYLSFKIANNLKKKFDKENIKINSCLDVCSGSGEFLNFMAGFVPTCIGIDNADGYLEYVKQKFKNIAFYKTQKLHEFKLDQKVDLVTCNHDVINMFLNFDEWKTFFKCSYNCLNPGGYLVFDFYTTHKMDTIDKCSFEQDFTLDYVQKISHDGSNVIMNEVYYIREGETIYRKTSDKMIETAFDTNLILDAVKQAGFSIETTNINLEPLESLDGVDRIHCLCKKQ